jgi:hypothetical protein
LYLNYDVISTFYPGWTLNEVRGLNARERKYWLKMGNWKMEKRRV